MWQHGVTVHFKGGQKLRNIPVSPKGKDNMTKKKSAICCYSCNRTDCDGEYIRKPSGTFGERLREHLHGTITNL